MEKTTIHPASENRDLRTAFWIFSTAFLFFAIVAPMGQMPSDTEYSIATARAIVFQRSLALQQTERLWSFARTTTGRLHSRYGLGYAVSFVPQVIMAAAASRALPLNPGYILEFVLSFTNTFYAALIAAVFFLLFRRLGYTQRPALTGTLLVSCASILFPYSKIIHAEIPTALCLMLFLWELAGGRILDIRKGAVLGCLASALYLLKIGNAPLSCIVGSFALVCIARRRFTAGGCALFSVLAVLPLCGMIALNKHYFGAFFNFGYGTEQAKFTTPVFTGLAGFFLSPSKSMLVFSPLLVLCFAGMKRFTKSHPLVASYALAIIVVDVLFYSKWHDWSGGWCWGPRLIVPAIIVCHVFIAGFIGAANTGVFRRALPGLLVLASIWINALGALVWYQQVYYFHRDYSSVRYSHPVCASRLLVHKLQGRPEIYACADFGADCSRPAYHADWDNIIRGDSIDFTSFEKYRGLATMWTGIAENFSWKWALLAPVLLLAGSLGCARRLWLVTRRS